MTLDFNVRELDYQKRVKNLDTEAHGVVKSKKNFPVFVENGKEYIFKPLSKTKPLSTPFFAYSEVFWSNIINNYFDPSTPLYKLAICQNYDEDFIGKYHHGTIVESLERQNQQIINLYDLLLNCKDNPLDKKYINACEQDYDYSLIFDTEAMNDERKLGEALAYQILLSILRLDQNYHYENPLFYSENGKVISMTPPIDHEFSTFFMYLDQITLHKIKYEKAIKNIDPDKKINYYLASITTQNIEKIISKYPHVARRFLENLQRLIQDLETKGIKLVDNNYLTPFNSSNFMVGHSRYKDHDEKLAKKLESSIVQHTPDLDTINELINEEIINSCHTLKKVIEQKMD